MGRPLCHSSGPYIHDSVRTFEWRLHLLWYQKVSTVAYWSVDGKITTALIEKTKAYCGRITAYYLSRHCRAGFAVSWLPLERRKSTLTFESKSKAIIIVGSIRDRDRTNCPLSAETTLDIGGLSLGDHPQKPDRAVCWTEAEDAYRTPCGHLYCQECFAIQHSSAKEGDLASWLRWKRRQLP